jgi:hypothetical protein
LKTEITAVDRERLLAFMAELPDELPVQEDNPVGLGEVSPG